ncbi:MAG: hypothetical protein NVSMB32_18680 [Actinomycetota bacterium]
MKFQAELQLHGKTATGFDVPPEIVAALGHGKRPAVRVTLGKHTYRSSVAPMGGKFLLGVSAENRAAAGVAAGDVVDVDLELDTERRDVAVPADLAQALAADPDARTFFESLSNSHKLSYVAPVEAAKKADTRERRVTHAIAFLREGRKQR